MAIRTDDGYKCAFGNKTRGMLVGLCILLVFVLGLLATWITTCTAEQQSQVYKIEKDQRELERRHNIEIIEVKQAAQVVANESKKERKEEMNALAVVIQRDLKKVEEKTDRITMNVESLQQSVAGINVHLKIQTEMLSKFEQKLEKIQEGTR